MQDKTYNTKKEHTNTDWLMSGTYVIVHVLHKYVQYYENLNGNTKFRVKFIVV